MKRTYQPNKRKRAKTHGFRARMATVGGRNDTRQRVSGKKNKRKGECKMIAIGCDHGGFALKKELIPFIDSLGYETIDIGCYDENSVDYPDVAFSLAEKVGSGEISRGIIVCGTGIGVSICANK